MEGISLHKLNNKQKLLILIGVCALVRYAFILFMPYTFSNDIYGWLKVIEVMDLGKNPYEETVYLNWPPLWMNILFCIHKLGQILSIPDIRMIQFFLIFCDLILLIILYRFSKSDFLILKPEKILLFGFILNPAFLFLTCQHGNFDVIIAIFVLLFVIYLSRYNFNEEINHWYLACLFLGLGILTKTIPLLLAPLLLIHIQKRSFLQNFSGAIISLTPVVVAMLIIYSQAPEAVTKNVLNYRSQPGTFGFTGMISLSESESVFSVYKIIFYSTLLFFLGFLSYLILTKKHLQKTNFVLYSTFFILLFIPLFGPGYASQYIFWFFSLGLLIYLLEKSKRMKNLFLITFGIIILTYIIEYGLFNSHGAFMDKFIVNKELTEFIACASTGKIQFLIRFPLFICYFLIIVSIGKRLFSKNPIYL